MLEEWDDELELGVWYVVLVEEKEVEGGKKGKKGKRGGGHGKGNGGGGGGR